jgi:hypothetical protein
MTETERGCLNMWPTTVFRVTPCLPHNPIRTPAHAHNFVLITLFTGVKIRSDTADNLICSRPSRSLYCTSTNQHLKTPNVFERREYRPNRQGGIRGVSARQRHRAHPSPTRNPERARGEQRCHPKSQQPGHGGAYRSPFPSSFPSPRHMHKKKRNLLTLSSTQKQSLPRGGSPPRS